MASFFIHRPIFAAVISIIITLAGGIAVFILPVAQYPEITPPTVQVSCFYPGASSKVVADTVASPIEQQVIGVENMLYMSSQSTNDGGYNLTVTFEVGTNLDMAQVLVQNRVNLALPSLPSEVKQTGVSVKKKSPNILLVVNLISPTGDYDQLYLSNYATIQIRDELAQIKGVGDVTYLGQLDYSMRVWLDPNKMASRNLAASDVVAALREQNVQVAAGALGRPPVPAGQAFQYTLSTLGRLTQPEEFGDIIVKTGENGQLTRMRDLVTDPREDSTKRLFGGIQLGAKNEDTSCALDAQPSIGLAIFQQPGSNALTTAALIRERMEELKKSFPKGLDFAIVYDTTPFIDESIKEVFKALRDAIILVAIVVLAFLQSWRATVIPLIAVPVAIIGTFAVMLGLGFSLNNLSLFGLVLAIGIVVDDAIVVVEAVEHHLEHGLSPKEAATKAMQEVTGPIIAISLVLMCVFIPCAFISGITGQFFRQFALTIAVSTFFSAVNSLTLSPALCGLLLKPKHEQSDPLTRLINLLLGWFFKLFNLGFTSAANWYSKSVGMMLRVSVIVLAVYGGLLYLTYYEFTSVPTGFIPSQDKGYLLVDVRLPDSASLERTKEVMAQVERIARGAGAAADAHDESHDHGHGESKSGGIPGVAHTITISGQSIVQNAIGSNFGTVYVILDDFHLRHGDKMGAEYIAAQLRAACFAEVQDASVAVFGAPAVDGLGSAGGFKVMVRDTAALGLDSLQDSADTLASEGNKQPGLVGMFSGFRAQTPQMYVDIDRRRCKAMGIPLSEVFLTLQLYLGGYYTNDFNQFGRTWQVNLQGDPDFRLTPKQVQQLKVRNQAGQMVPLGSVCNVTEFGGPALVIRYNGVTAAAVNGGSLPGVSSGSVVKFVEEVGESNLPQGMNLQWTELTLLQIRAGNTALVVFALAVVLVFLVLAAQYESLTLPLAVILVVPMCLLCSVVGVDWAGLDINIFVQIGFVVLVGLASKNAILIVEFAKEKTAQGASPADATVEACRLRLRPIIMTSLAFILGVVPLAIAVGAGAEMRSTLGIAVFSGMLGVTLFGIFLTPVFYYLVVKLTGAGKPANHAVAKPESAKPESKGH
ncbi:transporter, hydrophobe/amphiphile efflux-1 (HAE1) family [Pirellula staleyi DSM 6068]|uniref:Transporter, hydrophobe/amphiphile efflux-1 (HAE1) family n=1 Tax=Pirellula staleyi (strain ATCC 27377 / DSM 6068 / ICPB 4128) TaxID=530564 RepID=D2R3K4_PIRSD|nr:multidrug efflux RND transporter permease subunit [Pirellula staleyi]ADB16958.1 transporter, hydrophobe/amphiphile efflux-1 (HAE1) family [Pirellula staleyi DSM 6068]